MSRKRNDQRDHGWAASRRGADADFAGRTVPQDLSDERPVQVPVAELDDGETPVVRRTTNLAVRNIKATRPSTVLSVS